PGHFSETDTIDQEPPRKKRTDWDHHNTALLLKFWRRNLPTLRREKRHSKTMEEIREALCKYGVRKTSAEIKSKMKNLQSKYRTEKSRMKENLKYKTTWVFYNDFHSMMMQHPISHDPLKSEDENELTNNVESNSNHSVISLNPQDADVEEIYKVEPEHRPPTPPPPKRHAERKLVSVHEDLLQEIRRSNT
uniref:Myb/SANT-like DNA-binding domain-containing protein n=1 Tax=Lutzomyia longipalpis TaxID=7200 RepID=A0A1B0CFI9_LUTLO